MYSSLISFSESGIANKKGAPKEALPRPYLRVNATRDNVTLEFDMERQESILIYSRRGEEPDFILLTETNKPFFIDQRSNLTKYSEIREYKAIFSANGEPVGEEDLVKIKTRGRFRFF